MEKKKAHPWEVLQPVFLLYLCTYSLLCLSCPLTRSVGKLPLILHQGEFSDLSLSPPGGIIIFFFPPLVVFLIEV